MWHPGIPGFDTNLLIDGVPLLMTFAGWWYDVAPTHDAFPQFYADPMTVAMANAPRRSEKEQEKIAGPPFTLKDAFHQNMCMEAKLRQTFGNVELGIQKPVGPVSSLLTLGKSPLGPYGVILSGALVVDGSENLYGGKLENWAFSCGPN
jgi:hypothetical protein